ncbi:MAG TPA: hypothetical protein VGL70_02015 [Candidatus Binatia bacterium]|jgi:hypothetical protein
MKKFLGALITVATVAALLAVATVATAQWRGPHGPGTGPMGHGMMGGQGFGATETQITDEKARELAQQYADKNLAGFKVERVLPSTGMRHTMYVVELKNAGGELRTIHINPFGGVMPFGGPRGT